MLTTLIESRAVRTRNTHAQFLSLALHSALIAGAVFATQRAVDTVVEVAQPDVVYRVPVEPAPTQPTQTVPTLAELKGFRLVPTIITIPDVLPPIDLSKPLTNAADYLGAQGVPGGNPDGVEAPRLGDAMRVEQVDRAASLIPGTGRPVFPEAMRNMGIAGEVLTEFVIDTLGRAEMRTLTIVSSTHERFSESVARSLPKARFVPAEFGGRKVRQVVRMPFVFSLKK